MGRIALYGVLKLRAWPKRVDQCSVGLFLPTPDASCVRICVFDPGYVEDLNTRERLLEWGKQVEPGERKREEGGVCRISCVGVVSAHRALDCGKLNRPQVG